MTTAPVDELIHRFIYQWADRAEQEGGGRMAFAGIVGSRGQGLAHERSDWDVLGFYLRPPLAYLTLQETAPGHLYTASLPGFEAHAQDMRRVLQLLGASNPTILEALQTPLVVRETPVIEALREWAQAHYSPAKLIHHYGSIVRTHYRRYVEGRPAVDRKELLHCVRAAVALYYVYYQRAVPPLDTHRLLADTTMPPLPRQQALTLVATSPGPVGPPQTLVAWLQEVIDLYPRLADEAGPGRRSRVSALLLEDLFRQALAESYGATVSLEGTPVYAR